MVKWSFRHFPLTTQNQVLDIGVGNGVSTFYLKQQLKQGQVIGIDLSETAIAEVRVKNKHEDIQFEVMNAQNLLFETETFDLVTAFQTHFHWTDLDVALYEIKRVLKLNGVVLFACETAKLNYYLPALKHAETFILKMNNLNFSLVAHNQTKQWTMYAFQKNNPIDKSEQKSV